MKFVATALKAPIPIILAIPQVELNGSPIDNGPEWLLGAVAGIWLIIWVLEKAGKLPLTTKERRRLPKFEASDREAIASTLSAIASLSEKVVEMNKREASLYQLLTIRDADGVERWISHNRATHDTRERVDSITELLGELVQARDSDRRVNDMTVTTLQSIQKALIQISKRTGHIPESLDSVTRSLSALKKSIDSKAG